MGTRTLEARLVARTMLLAVPALALVAIAAVVATRSLLDAADSATAKSYAVELAEMYRRELGENDAPETALAELRSGIEATDVRLSVVEARSVLKAKGSPVPAAALLELGPGACASAADPAGHAWLGCVAGDGSRRVVVAIPVEAHHRAVSLLAEVLGAVLVLILAGLLLAIRGALRAPLLELGALVRWAGLPVERERTQLPAAETREIGELQSAFDALVQRLLEALARERARSAHIAHELRTPLTAILAELDASEPASESERSRVARMRRDVERLSNAIDAILLLAGDGERVRSDAIVNLSDVVRELAPAALELDAPDEALVEGDERLLSMAVANLLENADRYAGGARKLTVVREGELIRLSVADEGPGLDDEARARIFERYFRAAAGGEGKGLGLAFVRAVAERHGGRAEARPGPEGRGLEVSLWVGPIAGWHDAVPGSRH